MFTGIVEGTGFVKGLSRKKDAYRLKVLTGKELSPLKKGDSLAISGSCLTLVDIKKNFLFFDIIEETFRKTSFKYLRYNDIVNIERALQWKSRIDGHFVSGHIDTVQRIKAIKKYHRPYIDISTGKNDKIYIVEKCSIAIDGISLTIGVRYESKIRIYIIPHTLLHTNLKYKKTGDRVNIEFDMLGKYLRSKFA